VRGPTGRRAELDLVGTVEGRVEILGELAAVEAIVLGTREQLEREWRSRSCRSPSRSTRSSSEPFQARRPAPRQASSTPSNHPDLSRRQSGRLIYFVMKFLRGKPLSSVLAARGTAPPGRRSRQILVQVARRPSRTAQERALCRGHRAVLRSKASRLSDIMFDEALRASGGGSGISGSSRNRRRSAQAATRSQGDVELARRIT